MHISSKANQSVDASFPEYSSGDIGVFQHTPMATHIDIGWTKCTGEENSRTFLQRRTSPMTRLSRKILQAISASWPIASRCRCLTPTNAASRVSFQHISSVANQSVDTFFRQFSSSRKFLEVSSADVLSSKFCTLPSLQAQFPTKLTIHFLASLGDKEVVKRALPKCSFFI